MKPYLLIVILISCSQMSGVAQMRHFSIYVDNSSDFDIRCEGMPEKGEGIFVKYRPTLKAHQKFAFVIESNKSAFPKGVEGILRFRLDDPKYPGYLEFHFDNPISGSPEFMATAVSFPFSYQEFPIGEIDDVIQLPEKAIAIRISVDTTTYGSQKVTPLTTGGISGNNTPSDMLEPIPPIINFDWQVTQRMQKDDEDDNNGKAYRMVTYYFTTNGDYTATKSEDQTFSLMIYSKKGHTWTIYDAKKTIIVMDMPKTVGEGGMAGKEVAEEISKKPVQKDRDEDGETLDVVKTGKTKNILGYTADEYLMKTKQKNAATASFWYVKVPFDPVKIYTMGVGRPADLSKLQNNPKYKNSVVAIPVLNLNYLWAETEAGGKKGQETLEIKHVNNTVYTAGYKIKVTHNLREAMKAEMEMNN